MKYTLYDLLYAKGVSEPLREAVQALMAKLGAAEKELESWKGLAAQFGEEAEALRTHLSFAKDELNRLRAEEKKAKHAAALREPHPRNQND